MTLSDSWLSGFTDSEGCFSASISKSSKGFKYIFDITQKNSVNKPILTKLHYLFKVGYIYKHDVYDTFTYRVGGLRNCEVLFKYFDNFPLKTKKLKSYIIWKDLHKKLTDKNHLNPVLRNSLQILASKVNNTWV